MNEISVVVIDDHPLMIEAISGVLGRNGFKVVGVGVSASDIVDLCERNAPNIAIVDLHMPGDVYAAIGRVLIVSPATKVIAFTAATGVDVAIRALDAGASGYVLKGSQPDELTRAISSVVAGETYITQTFASRVIAGLRDTTARRRAAADSLLSFTRDRSRSAACRQAVFYPRRRSSRREPRVETAAPRPRRHARSLT